MKLRDIKKIDKPDLIIIPMIDIMFFLLVFFMLSTMYMINQQTIPVQLPQATSSAIDDRQTFTVTLKDNGDIYLADEKITLEVLLEEAKLQQSMNNNFAIIIRADKNIPYEQVVNFIDELNVAGIHRLGLATEDR